MRVASRGNLTVELIRLERFALPRTGCAEHDPLKPNRCTTPRRCDPKHEHPVAARTDRVELSGEALASDPWSAAVCRKPVDPFGTRIHADSVVPRDDTPPPRTITPVIGSPALAGLGVALIVPGTLLDVVA